MNNWISVKDRLPEIEVLKIKRGSNCYSKSFRVLCACKQQSGKRMVKEGYYEISTRSNVPLWRIPGSIDKVTHWQPLPELPKED